MRIGGWAMDRASDGDAERVLDKARRLVGEAVPPGTLPVPDAGLAARCVGETDGTRPDVSAAVRAVCPRTGA